jgi:hypothetical protein
VEFLYQLRGNGSDEARSNLAQGNFAHRNLVYTYIYIG